MHLSPRSLGVPVVALALALALGACGSTARAPEPDRPMAVVPQLIGRHQEDAHRLAAAQGLKLRWMGFVGKLGNGRYNVPCVKVHSQSPVAGERRPRGASVWITESACVTPTGRPHVA